MEESEEEHTNPYLKIASAFMATENDNRATVLLSAYLAERADRNHLNDIIMLTNKLKEEENQMTRGAVTGAITALVNAGLMGREREAMLGTKKVSFHEVLFMGRMSLLYLLGFQWGDGIYDFEDEDFSRRMRSMTPEQAVDYLLDKQVRTITACRKILEKAHAKGRGDPLERMKVRPPDLSVKKILGDRLGTRLRLFEEFIWDSFNTGIGETRKELEEKLKLERLGSHIKALSSFLESNTDGKTAVFSLGRQGRLFLWIFLLYLWEVTKESHIVDATKLFTITDPPDGDIRRTLTRNALAILYDIYHQR